MTTDNTEPSAEAMALVREFMSECGPSGACTAPPCACALALDRFQAAGVEAERERTATFREDVYKVRTGIFYWMTRNHHRGEQSYARLGEAKEALTEAIKAYDGDSQL